MSDYKFHYLINLSYFGEGFFGWQVQPDLRTIQGSLNQAISTVISSDDFHTIGSSRTDKNVSAFSQYCKLSTNIKIPEENLRRSLNRVLNSHVFVKEISLVKKDFHPIFSDSEKEYIYLFKNNDPKNIFEKKFVTSFYSEIDIDLMMQGAKLFLGEKDFQNYYCIGTEYKSTIRHVTYSEILPIHMIDFPITLSKNCFAFKVKGNGFLKQMVRLMMGSLVELGKGKRTLNELEGSFNQKLDQKLGPVVPGNSLFLNNIKYLNC